MGRTLAIIPARLGSTRFPRKVLASDTGRPLIAHVVECASRVPGLDGVLVATDAQEVADAAHAAGVRAVITSADHPNGTSRLAQAADILRLANDDIILNIQGDEPELEPALPHAAINALGTGGCRMATAAVPLLHQADIDNPNIVKVVRRIDGCALYFSRAAIPFPRDSSTDHSAGHAHVGRALRHVGIYAYERTFLALFARLASTPLERLESLEQLRALEHGHSIGVAVVNTDAPQGIDTRAQYEDFVRRFQARGRAKRQGSSTP